jgi:hypothetical protein
MLLMVLLMESCWSLAVFGAAASLGSSDTPPVVEIDGDLDYKAVQCAACEFVVDHLDRAVRDSLLEAKTVAVTKRAKPSSQNAKLKRKVEIPWIESELGWGEAVDAACGWGALSKQAYFTKGNAFKLFALESLTGQMRDMAESQVLGRDKGMYRQFERACQGIIDEYEVPLATGPPAAPAQMLSRDIAGGAAHKCRFTKQTNSYWNQVSSSTVSLAGGAAPGGGHQDRPQLEAGEDDGESRGCQHRGGGGGPTRSPPCSSIRSITAGR